MISGRRRGFTLIELLTVIAIIAILAGFTFAVLPRIRERAKLRRMENAMIQIRTAMTSYYADKNTYPPGYGFVVWEARDFLAGEKPDAAMYFLTPYMACLRLQGDLSLYDEFSEGYDTNRDGIISLAEFLPVGTKSMATNIIKYPEERYDQAGNRNKPAGELNKLEEADRRPFVYAPVNSRQFAKARKYWMERGALHAEAWDPQDPLLKDLSFPPPSYDAFVLVSPGPGGNTSGVVPEPLGTEDPRDVYHILALRTFFLATRDLNDNGLKDYDFEARRTQGEGKLVYDVQVQVNPAQVIRGVDNKLPCEENRDSWGPVIFAVK